MVGAAYAAGKLADFEQHARSIERRHLLAWLDLSFQTGVFRAERVLAHLRSAVPDVGVDELPKTFAAVAASFDTGDEVVMDRGSLCEAIRASIALPGLIAPARAERGLFIDGGIVNPVPTSAARALGARTVIAVEIVARTWEHRLGSVVEPIDETGTRRMPGTLETMSQAAFLMQTTLTRHRLAGGPPTVAIRPQVGHIGLLDFHRAEEAISEGRRALGRSHTRRHRSRW